MCTFHAVVEESTREINCFLNENEKPCKDVINGKTFQNTIYTQERLESKNKTFFYLKNEKKNLSKIFKA